MDPRKLAPLQNQIKEKDNIISTLNQEKTMLQNELNSFPIKKQNLEIKNLEQDLKNKELQSCVLKKELGNKFVKNININYIDKNSAKSRIQNHLSYKLGQALITNSKSILGYIRMPFVLSYIKDKHKFEQKPMKAFFTSISLTAQRFTAKRAPKRRIFFILYPYFYNIKYLFIISKNIFI